MELTRRELLKLAAGSAAALGLGADQLIRLEEALAATTSPPVLWLQGQSCTGCSISLLNATNPTIDSVLLNTISMKYHPNLSAASGDMAITAITNAAASGGFILCVEGAIPTAAGGKYCTIGRRNGAEWTVLQAVQELGPKAKRVISVGTCAAHGGVARPSRYTGVQSVRQVLTGRTAQPVISLPGCPTHPNTVLGTIVTLLTGGALPLDSEGKPTAYYGSSVHSRCPRREMDEVGQVGIVGCYEEIGCKGPSTKNNCPSRKWNNGVNWCIGANMACIGCASPSFPANPLYRYIGGGD